MSVLPVRLALLVRRVNKASRVLLVPRARMAQLVQLVPLVRRVNKASRVLLVRRALLALTALRVPRA